MAHINIQYNINILIFTCTVLRQCINIVFRLKLGVFIDNGGFLNITDLDTNDTLTHYYSGSSITPLSLLVIDTHPPTHCSIVPSHTCLANQNPLKESLIHNDLTVVWGGWRDEPAGIIKYKLEVYKLVYDSVFELLERADSFVFARELNDDGRVSYAITDLSLSDEGPYSIVLVGTDGAGNRQYSRRILVYDDTSILTEDVTKPLVVIGGFINTGGGSYWHNSTTTPIRVGGEGHFYNTNLRTSNWLAPVANHTPSIPAEYDDEDRYGVPNALGITRLAFTYIIDQQGGTSAAAITQPSSYPHQTDDLSLSAVEVTPTIDDGESVSIWFEGRDFKGNTPVYEKVLVHVDSSPPVLGGLGLRQDGVSELVYLYGLSNLLDLKVVFEAHDVHSGLYEVEWKIRTATEDIALGQIGIQNYERVS